MDEWVYMICILCDSWYNMKYELLLLTYFEFSLEKDNYSNSQYK